MLKNLARLILRPKVVPYTSQFWHSSNFLPAAWVHPADEFKQKNKKHHVPPSIRYRGQVARHFLHSAWREAFSRDAVLVISVSMGFVAGSCMLEAAIFSALPLLDPQLSKFMFQYTLHNILPSFIWQAQDPQTVAAALGLDPEVFFKPAESKQIKAQRTLAVDALRTSRAIVAGYMVLGMLVKVITSTIKVGEEYERAIMQGDSTLRPDVYERVFRLCGSTSDGTVLSLRWNGPHILPIYEEPERIEALLKEQHRRHMIKLPMYWRMPRDAYGRTQAWERLSMSQNDLLRTSTGRRVLVLEADATNSEESLALRRKSGDLTLDDAEQAFRQLERVCRACIRHETLPWHLRSWMTPKDIMYGRYDDVLATQPPAPGFRVLRVLLADTHQPVQIGGGTPVPLEQKVRQTKEVDVLIDSRAPVLLHILKWAVRIGNEIRRREAHGTGNEEADKESSKAASEQSKEGAGKKKAIKEEKEGGKATDDEEGLTIGGVNPFERLVSYFALGIDVSFSQQPKLVVETDDDEYFVSLKHLLEAYGFNVVNSSDTSPEEMKSIPRFIYYTSTARTVNAAYALVKAGVIDPTLCCVLVDQIEGAEELESVLAARVRDKKQSKHRAKAQQRGDDAKAAATGSDKDRSSDKKESGREGSTSSNASNTKDGNSNTRDAKAAKDQQKSKDTPAKEEGEQQEQAPSMPGAFTMGMHVVCSAVVYDDLFRSVRQLIRSGHTPAEVQAMLDDKFQKILELQEIRVPRSEQQQNGENGDSKG